jgi:hypothetical protein
MTDLTKDMQGLSETASCKTKKIPPPSHSKKGLQSRFFNASVVTSSFDLGKRGRLPIFDGSRIPCLDNYVF